MQHRFFLSPQSLFRRSLHWHQTHQAVFLNRLYLNHSVFQGNLYNSVETGIVKLIVSNSYDTNYLIKPSIKISETDSEFKFKYNDLLDGKIENCELDEFTLIKSD